jgi:hypothetical protein
MASIARRNSISTPFLILLIFAFGASLATAAEAPAWEARITTVDGDAAFVFPGGKEDGMPATTDMPVDPGDRIETGDKSRIEIALASKSVFAIGPNSSFTLDAPEEQDGSWVTGLTLSLGSFMAKVKRLAGENSIEIRTPTAVAAVRGTEFGLDVTQGGETDIRVYDEGRVGILSREDPTIEETILAPNQEAQVTSAKKMRVTEDEGRRFLRTRPLKNRKKHASHLSKLRQRQQHVHRKWKAHGKKRSKLRRRMQRNAGRLSQKQRQRIRSFGQKRHSKLGKQRAGLNRRLQRVRQKHGTMKQRMQRHRSNVRQKQQGQRENRQQRQENMRKNGGDQKGQRGTRGGQRGGEKGQRGTRGGQRGGDKGQRGMRGGQRGGDRGQRGTRGGQRGGQQGMRGTRQGPGMQGHRGQSGRQRGGGQRRQAPRGGGRRH